MTFRDLQDAVLERFNSSRRNDCKEWIRYVYGQLWDADEWTFKLNSTQVQVTAGSNLVTGLPEDFGIPHELLNTNGVPLTWMDPAKFERMHNSETQTSIPWDYTVYGAGLAKKMLCGPISSETATYTLVYEKSICYRPSTTLAQTVTLPVTSLPVADVSVAGDSAAVFIGDRYVTYTGFDTPSKTLTGCANGNGTFQSGTEVVYATTYGGSLSADTDVPAIPFEFHQLLVFGALAIGQSMDNDYSLYLSDDRVQQGLDAMRRRYLVDQRGQLEQWGSYAYGHLETGGGW
jgi:hypothetical protein